MRSKYAVLDNQKVILHPYSYMPSSVPTNILMTRTEAMNLRNYITSANLPCEDNNGYDYGPFLGMRRKLRLGKVIINEPNE